MAFGVKVKAEHAPAGVDKDLLRRAVRVHAQDGARSNRGVELAIRGQHHMFGADFLADVDLLQARQAGVAGVRADITRCHGRLPAARGDRHWPQTQVGARQQDQQQQAGEHSFHDVSSISWRASESSVRTVRSVARRVPACG